MDANFAIALLGFLLGVRLQRQGWLHFGRCPIVRGKLCDFYATRPEIVQTLAIGSQFWMSMKDESTAKLAYATLHWHLLAQLYAHGFEKLHAQFVALDACRKLATKLGLMSTKHRGHAERLSVLCEALEVDAPGWIRVGGTPRTSKLSVLRNTMVHEGLFDGEPIGFAESSKTNELILELTALVARVYLRLMGVNNEYTRSSCTTRQTIGFSFDHSGR